MPGWMKHKLESRLLGEISIASDMKMIPHLWQKVKKSLKSLLKVKEESEKVGLKCNIQKTKIMNGIWSHHFMANRWGNNGNSDRLYFSFFGSKITANSDWSHEIKRHLLLGRKVMTNLDSILKSRDITLATKVRLVKAMVFPAVMYGCDSWTVKKDEHRKLMLLNCGVGEDSWESLGLQGDPTSPFQRRPVLGVLWKEWC